MHMCSNCGTSFELRGANGDLTGSLNPGRFNLESTEHHYARLCSVSCLTEYAWKLREQQEKLSKSKGPTPRC